MSKLSGWKGLFPVTLGNDPFRHKSKSDCRLLARSLRKPSAKLPSGPEGKAVVISWQPEFLERKTG